MRVSITVKPNARHEGVTVQPDGSLRVAVNAPPTEGRANARLIELVAAHFGVARSRVRVVHGAGGRRKLVEVL